MSQFQQLLLNAINALTNRLNSIENNGKKIDELTAQTVLNYASRLHVSLAGESERIDIQQIISAAILEFENKVNRFIQIGSLALDGNDLNITGTWIAIINGLSRTNGLEPTINIPFTTTDKVRGDLIVFDADGDIVRIAGAENDLGLYFFPTLPPNTLLITPLVVTDSTISAPVDPELPSAPYYVGSEASEEDFLAQRGGSYGPVLGCFGFVQTTGVFEIAFYDGTDWLFYDLISSGGGSTPHNQKILYEGASITVPLGFEGIVTNLNDIYADVTFTVSTTSLTITAGANSGEMILINGKY